MSKITIKKATTKREMKDFVALPHRLYKHCEQYVPDLDSDIHDMFNPKKNAGLEYSELQPFVAYDETGVCVGRIAAILNHRANEKWGVKNVRFGLIEFENDEQVSAALIEAVEDWGKERGMTHVQGPLGILDFDKEGMLVEDFDMIGSMVTIYNPAYYPQHMEALGLEKEVDWLQVRVAIPGEVPAKYARVAKYARETFGLRVVKMTDSQLGKGGYGRKIFELLNVAFSPLFGFTDLTDSQIDDLVKRYIPLIDKRLVPIVMNEKDEIVGVAITMGSLSKALQKSKGKLFPFGWYHLLKAIKFRSEPTVEMLLIAVRPDYQGQGVNALYFEDLIPVYNKLGFKWAESGPQLEDNVRELSQWRGLEHQFVRRRRCYNKPIGGKTTTQS